MQLDDDIQKNRNTVQNSEVSTGRDLHIGDKKSETNTVINHDNKYATTLLIIVIIGLFFLFGFIAYLFKDHLFPSTPDSKASDTTAIVASTQDASTTNIVPPASSTSASTEKVEKKLITEPKEVLIALNINGADQALVQIAQDHIGRQITDQGLKFITQVNSNTTQELRCSIRMNIDEKDLVRTLYIVTANMSATLYELPTTKATKSYQFQKKEWTLYDKADIPAKFEGWLVEASQKFNSLKLDIKN